MASNRWEKQVEKHETVLSGVVASDRVCKLLERQHKAMIKAIRKRGDEYMRDASNSMCSKDMQRSAASKAWAFKDFACELAALRQKGTA